MAHRAAAQAPARCPSAIVAAERAEALPAGLLPAIARVESGRPDPLSGRIGPWPWTIDADGVGRFFATKDQAIAAVVALQAEGVRSIDVGCLQVNLAQHPDAFASLDDAFDPAANAIYAARFLRALYAGTGDWAAAAAAYHSRTPAYAEPYRQLVMAAWEGGHGVVAAVVALRLLPIGAGPPPHPFAPPPLTGDAAAVSHSNGARLVAVAPACAPQQPASPWTPPHATMCPGSPFANAARLLQVLGSRRSD